MGCVYCTCLSPPGEGTWGQPKAFIFFSNAFPVPITGPRTSSALTKYLLINQMICLCLLSLRKTCLLSSVKNYFRQEGADREIGSSRWVWTCPLRVCGKYHKPGALKQQKMFVSWSGGWKCETRCWQGQASWTLQGSRPACP